MDKLEVPKITLNKSKQDIYSSTKSLDTRNDDNPLSVRLTSSYRSLRNKHTAENYRRRVTINNTSLPRHNIDRFEIDAGEPPPVDESFYFDNLECYKNNYVNSAKLKFAIYSIINPGETMLLLNMEKSGILPSTWKSEKLRNVAYIWASYRGLIHLLPILENAGARFDYIEPRTGINALLAASLSNKESCVKYLIEKGVDVNYENLIIRYRPLHFAALGNSWHTATVLLDNGAKLNYVSQEMVEPILHSAVRTKAVETVKLLLERGASIVQKNHLGQTALHVACFVQSIPCVKLLLNSAADTDVNAVDREHRTPLHFAVMNTDSSVELVQLLLKNGALVNTVDKTGFTSLHIAALNEQSQCVDVLIWAGADVSATTFTGLSALNIILRKIPESLHVFRQKLDASIRLIRPESHNREFEMRLHFDILFPSNNNQCETSFINTFVQEHQKDLLSHPLVMAFLHLKWEKIRKLYLLRILLYTMTVICMTTYVLTALTYKCYNYNEANNSRICIDKIPSNFLFRKPIMEIEWYLALVLTCITIPRKILGFMVYKTAIQYFSNIENVLDGVVITSVFITSFIYTGRTYDWQNYVGAFAILCAWTNLMLMIGQLPAFGTYVAMFTHIQLEFAKLLLAYSGLLIGFTISFCVIFASEPAFDNPFTGLIKVLAMMSGELNFDGLINQPKGSAESSVIIYHPLSVCSQILVTLFIVFVTVILMNLLVGIAVHDIQGLRTHAGLTKLVRQTKLILFTEMILHNASIPYVFRKWMSDHKINVENRKRVLVVKPLNPLEKRLPKDVLKIAYEIAQKNILFTNDDVNLNDHNSWLKRQNKEISDTALQTTVNKLFIMTKMNEDAIELQKAQLTEINKMLENIVKILKKEEHALL